MFNHMVNNGGENGERGGKERRGKKEANKKGRRTGALAELAVVFEGFVDDVPGVALTFVVAGDVLDVCGDDALHLVAVVGAAD